MEFKEILEKLKEGANFELKFENGIVYGYGAIDNFDECINNKMSKIDYLCEHYIQKQKILEALPWVIVKNPCNPKENEYPNEDGNYITMLDCDEHAVWVNSFKNGHWLVYDRTHVKWWIRIPENIEDLTKEL